MTGIPPLPIYSPSYPRPTSSSRKGPSNLALVSPVERELCEFFHELNQSSSLGLTGSEVVSLAKGNFVPSSSYHRAEEPPRIPLEKLGLEFGMKSADPPEPEVPQLLEGAQPSPVLFLPAPVSKVIDQPLPFPKIIKPPPPRKVIKPPPPPKVIEPPKVTLSSPKKCPQKRPPLPELIKIEDTTDISNVQLCGKEAPKQTSVGGAFQQIQESFRPAEWFSEVMPKRSPYFPQLGDELVYFRQGHELYVRQVENLNIYQMDKKMQKSLPYVQDPDLPPEISVRVVHIAFELQPPRLVNLKLERVDWNTGLHTGNSFNVRYHDLPSIADFLVLRQIYDKSVRHQWHADDRFRCMMDKTWWLGTVLAKQPYDSQYENSNFQCYSIIWDGEDQEPEQLSPWDMEIIPDDFVVPEDSKDRVPATDEEVRSSLYEVRPEDWEPHGHQDAECRRISTLVEGVMNLAIAEAFLTPVDLNAWPEYAYEIAYPMDLSTIKARLGNLFYRRAPAILTDVERIGMNAAEFNEPNSDIVKHARVVTKLLQEIVENEDFGNVSEAYHRLMASVSEETSAVAPTSPKKLKVCGEYSM